jgi:hypothetical protein
MPEAPPSDREAGATLHAVQVTGTYVRLEDLLVLLEG